MGNLSTLLLTWLPILASFHVQGYTIHPSCSNYITLHVGTKRVNLIPMLKEAMEEGRSMARLGERDIKDEAKDEYDDSKSALFRDVTEAQLTIAETNYKDLSDEHWQFTEYAKDPKVLTLYCGESGFSSNDGINWVLTDSKTTFRVRKEDVRQTGGKWRLCPANTEAFTSIIPGRLNFVFLCDVLDKVDNAEGVVQPERRGTYAQLYAAKRLGEKSSLRGIQDMVRVISKTLLHEMFHAIIGKPRILGGDEDEIAGWEKCTGELKSAGLTAENRVKNPETLALYAATRKISELDKDFGFSSGIVISRAKAQKAAKDKELQLQERIRLLFDGINEA